MRNAGRAGAGISAASTARLARAEALDVARETAAAATVAVGSRSATAAYRARRLAISR
jgi:hypothetical protein